MKWRIAFGWGWAAVSLRALIFPLPVGEKGAYDTNFNVLPLYGAGWTNGHAILNLHGANAVAIGPRWFVTAWHLARYMDETFWANDDGERYYIREKYEIGNDLALVRVDREFPFYSEIRKTPVASNEIVTVYGQSGAAEGPIYNSRLDHLGWRPALPSYSARLRWGRGRNTNTNDSRMTWSFTQGDLELGNGGLNCAAAATNDSGGGIFTGAQAVGVIIGGSYVSYRPSGATSVGSNCEEGMLFESAPSLSTCLGASPARSRATGASFYPYLSSIFAKISPPIYRNGGGGAVTNRNKAWESWDASGEVSTFRDESPVEVESFGIYQAAPQEVYKSQLYLEGKPGKAIALVAEELLKYERYTVRLHFASLNVADRPGRSTQRIRVNDQSAVLDPYTGPRRALDYVFYEVKPDGTGRITVTLTPENEFGNASVCGVEIAMVSDWPTAQIVPAFAPANAPASSLQFTGVAFGAGRFVATGTSGIYYSDDNGENFYAAREVPNARYFWIVYARDTFVALADSGLISRSKDGKQWVTQKIEEAGGLASLAFGGGVFVVTTDHGKVLISESGEVWDLAAQPTTNGLPFVVYGDGRFLAAENLTNFYSSTNGKDWTGYTANLPALPVSSFPRNPPPSQSGMPRSVKWGSIGGLVFGEGLYVMAALIACEDNRCESDWTLTSTDGTNWINTTTNFIPNLPIGFSARNPMQFFDHRLVFFSAGTTSSPSARLLGSTSDFENWTSYDTLAGSGVVGSVALAYGNGILLLAGSNTSGSGGPGVFRGADLDSLEKVLNPAKKPRLTSLTTRGQTVVGVDAGGASPIHLTVSTNGGSLLNPVDSEVSISQLNRVSEGRGTFVAVGAEGKILFSTDGQEWHLAVTPSTNDLFDAVMGPAGWIAVGAAGTVLASQDGARTFSRRGLNLKTDFSAAIYGNEYFVAVGRAVRSRGR